jgi:hypothetical protein
MIGGGFGATFGTMRTGTGSILGAAGISHAAVEGALASSFHFAFPGCAAISIVGFVIAIIAKDPMLRTTTYTTPRGE